MLAGGNGGGGSGDYETHVLAVCLQRLEALINDAKRLGLMGGFNGLAAPSEAKIREIVREEIEAAGVMRVKLTPGEIFTGDQLRELAAEMLRFQRDGGEVVIT